MHHIFLQGPNKHHAAEGSNQVHWGQGFKPSPSGLFEILQNQLRIDKTDSKKILEKVSFVERKRTQWALIGLNQRIDCSQTPIFPCVCRARSLSSFSRHLECNGPIDKDWG